MNWLREPLIHFLLLGALIFGVSRAMPKRGADAPGHIVISEGQIAALSATFERTWQRPPTQAELNGLIEDRIREEVCYREAKALGLDRDDTIIRRRLRQKLEFVSEDIAALGEPTDAELDAYLQAHPEAFHERRRFRFRQVHIDPQKHGENLDRDVARELAALKKGGGSADFSTMGDSRLLEQDFLAVSDEDVARQFGDPFAKRLAELPLREWVGPIPSGLGVHLVWVEDRTDGRLPPLGVVRAEVRREWENARRRESNERFYRELLKRYTVTVEGVGTGTAGNGSGPEPK